MGYDCTGIYKNDQLSDEELAKSWAIDQFDYKGYKIYVRSNGDGYLYFNLFDKMHYEVYEYSCYGFYMYDTKKDEILKKVFAYLDKHIFSEEELLSPCHTLSEYQRREEFLRQDYLKTSRWCEDYFRKLKGNNKLTRAVYNPVNECMMDIQYVEGIKHRIWLYAQHKKTIKPTIFPPVHKSQSIMEKVVTFLNFLPLASEDDPMYNESKEYIAKHAKDIALNYYPYCRDIVIQLVKDDYIKAPTMKKLLDMANHNGDVELAAILLDKLENKKDSKTRFRL